VSSIKFDLDQLCDALEEFERQKMAAETAIQNAKQAIQSQMNEQGVSSTTTKVGRKLTIVAPKRTSWDEDVLKDILGVLWAEVIVVKEVLDPAKLEVVVDREDIPPKSLEPAVVEHEVRPYLKITKPKHSTNPT
jgi:hypothetical protein